MSREINPILLDKTPSAGMTRRNWARPTEAASNVTFVEELEKAQTKNSQATFSTDNVAPVAKATTVTENKAMEKVNGTAHIKPATNWRVDRSAAEVHHEVNDLSLEDLWDLINPLQHIPILGSVYREMTGDEIKPFARVAGDVLFGAATGSLLISGLASVATAAYEQQTGEEPIVQVADALFGIKKSKVDAAPVTMLADASDKAGLGYASPDKVETVKLASAETPALMSVPSPAPVQVALLDGTAAKNTMSITTVDKPPYGGVMDTSAMARNQQVAAAKDPSPHVQGLRIGNTIYTNPRMNNSARLAAIQAERAKNAAGGKNNAHTETKSPESSDSNNSMTSSPFLASVGQRKMSIPTSGVNGDNQTEMSQKSAETGLTSRPLPPELVRDMMIMALDKYKTASSFAQTNADAARPN